MLNRNKLQLGILEADTSSISQLTDKGKALDPARRRTFVWLLDFDDFEKLKRNQQDVTFFYTQDAGISTAVLYGYRLGILGAKVLDLGVSPSGGGPARRGRTGEQYDR